jgi:transposase-like protein
MPKKRYTAEQIVGKLREAEVELSKGTSTAQVCKKIGVSEQTYHRWRREYGGLKMEQAKRLKLLERENARLKKLVADQALDIAILKEVSSGNFRARTDDGVPWSTCVACWVCRSAGHVGWWVRHDQRIAVRSRFRTMNLDWYRA